MAEYHDFSQEILSRHNQPAEVDTESIRLLYYFKFHFSLYPVANFQAAQIDTKSVKHVTLILNPISFLHASSCSIACFQSVRVETEFTAQFSLFALFKAYSSAKVAHFEPREVHTDQSHNYHSHFHSNLKALCCLLPTCASKYRFSQERTAFHFFLLNQTLSVVDIQCAEVGAQSTTRVSRSVQVQRGNG